MRVGELPPRVRGRRALRVRARGSPRATPAGAGTTPRTPIGRRRPGSYPRGCGDDGRPQVSDRGLLELPPRVRGRHPRRRRKVADRRATPAGAGTTSVPESPVPARRSYPRGCGDDQARDRQKHRSEELPPRVRGRHSPRRFGAGTDRATPAGAGTTMVTVADIRRAESYPRGCGDDEDARHAAGGRQELPPRVRGRPTRRSRSRPAGRATPAGAGTTRRAATPGLGMESYPRGCGDDR